MQVGVQGEGDQGGGGMRIIGVATPHNFTLHIHITLSGVTRPNRPGIDIKAEPPAVGMNDELGGLLTYKVCGGLGGGEGSKP